jgi:hypothetical protein
VVVILPPLTEMVSIFSIDYIQIICFFNGKDMALILKPRIFSHLAPLVIVSHQSAAIKKTCSYFEQVYTQLREFA